MNHTSRLVVCNLCRWKYREDDLIGPPKCEEHPGALICPACHFCEAAEPTHERLEQAAARREVYECSVVRTILENTR